MQKPDVSLFPASPGVYLFKDAQGRVLYAGKAKRLKHRLASYFRPEGALSLKTRLMVQQACSIDILHTATEKEALLLEASLIKKYRPRYNILLRDDKEYLLFRFRGDHPYPRLEIVRKSGLKAEKKTRGRSAPAILKGGQKTAQHAGPVSESDPVQYPEQPLPQKPADTLPEKDRLYGPFSSGSAAHETWRLIHRTFPLRRCREHAFASRTRPCLYHHMRQCLAPCVQDVPVEEYAALVRRVDLLLAGRSGELVARLEQEMFEASESLAFEKAALLRDQIQAVRRTVERQSVVLPASTDLDLVGVAQMPEGLALGVVFVRGGLLLDGRNFFWPGLGMEDTPELLRSFLSQYYLTGKATPPRRIVVPWLAGDNSPNDPPGDPPHHSPEDPTGDTEGDESPQALVALLSESAGHAVFLHPPRNTDEDRLVLLAAENAKEAAKIQTSRPLEDVLADVFRSPHPINRVEVVDISHTGGKQTRAGLVVFEAEQPVKSDYRAYNLEDIAASAGDDYAALAAFATRRAASGPPWPDLLLVDGGKGQLAAVVRALEEAGAPPDLLVASIAKARDDKGMADRRAGNVQDRIFVPGQSNPLPFKAGSPELLFLQHMRDTAHDFVLGRHRKARAKEALSGELTRLPGVGPKTARLLFEHFGNLSTMAKASEEELALVPGIGRARAKALHARLRLLVAEKK